MRRLIGWGLLAACWPAWGLNGEFAGLDVRLNTRLSAGVAVRTQDRARDLIAKLSVPGQQLLCAPDDCGSASGDVEPVRRLINAPGGFGLTNADDGNLNYDEGDITAATALIAPELTVRRGAVSFTASGMLFHDATNVGFDHHNSDDRYRPSRTPRSAEVERRLASDAELREAYVRAFVPAFGREIGLSIGTQTLPWGESNLLLFNSINEVNSLDGTVAGFPGFEIADVLIPVPLAIMQVPVSDFVSAELVYQYGWEGVRPPPAGSFLSTSDVAGGDRDYVMIGLGNTNEDPEGISVPAGGAGMISSASRRVQRLPDNEPRDGGQYGLRVSYYADWLNGGTELAFHYLHYHSRYPYLSTVASQFSCIRDAPNNDAVSAAVACEGFNGSANPAGGREPLPVDTMQAFIEYPEGIDMAGISFNTNLGNWAFTGDLSYRPNLPLQINQAEVIFAALQPAFPEQDLVIGPGMLPGFDPIDGVDLVIPGASNAVPSFIVNQRGLDVMPGDVIRGYERYRVAQLGLSGLRIWSHNLFGGDQLLLLLEAGVMHILDLTDDLVLPLQPPGDFTHAGAGADGTGTPDGQPDTRLQNPTQNRRNRVDDTSWGWRGIMRLTYNEVLPGVTVLPTLVWFHDVRGNSPSPVTNFIEGRKQFIANLDAKIGLGWTTGVSYTWFTGGGNAHLTRDRDHTKAFVAYEF